MTIFTKLSLELKQKVAVEWFGLKDSKQVTLPLEAFFVFYEKEIELLRVGVSETTWLAAHLAVKSHEDILAVGCILKHNQDKSRAHLHSILSTKLSDNDTGALDRSIDLCVRLWLMLNTLDHKFQSLRPLDTCLIWEQHKSLKEFVSANFARRSRKELSLKDARFDVNFTAASMIAICGLRIHWTSNIHDHLLLNRRRKLLSVFAFEHPVELAKSMELVCLLSARPCH